MKRDATPAEAYPLSWPTGWPRCAAEERLRAQFGRLERVYSSVTAHDGSRSSGMTRKELPVATALSRVQRELARLRAQDAIISTNVELRRDGLPRSDRRAPDDPGVAVYWRNAEGEAQCMAIDVYDTVAGNLAAVAASIEALRAIERHGGAQILRRAFQGFRALPASTTTALTTEQAINVIARWVDELDAKQIAADRWAAQAAVRVAASKTHPDRGGTTADFQLVVEARRVLERHFGGAL